MHPQFLLNCSLLSFTHPMLGQDPLVCCLSIWLAEQHSVWQINIVNNFCLVLPNSFNDATHKSGLLSLWEIVISLECYNRFVFFSHLYCCLSLYCILKSYTVYILNMLKDHRKRWNSWVRQWEWGGKKEENGDREGWPRLHSHCNVFTFEWSLNFTHIKMLENVGHVTIYHSFTCILHVLLLTGSRRLFGRTALKKSKKQG